MVQQEAARIRQKKQQRQKKHIGSLALQKKTGHIFIRAGASVFLWISGLRRKADLSVKGVEYLTEAETEEILKDMEETDADTDAKEVKPEASIKRLSKKELPDKVLKALGRCKDRTWYVIAYNGYQYLYYHGLPNNYAFQPELSNQKADIEIVDMGRAGTFDVLLAVKQNMTLAVHYRGRKISYQKAVV